MPSRHPNAKYVILQSDNATCFASQQHIPFIHNLNTSGTGIPITRWIFTEAQTGKGRLDTHFSYLNIVFKSFVADDNDIKTEPDIFRALQFNGGVAGSTAVLVNLTRLTGPIVKKAVSKAAFKAATGSRATHDIFWTDDNVKVYTNSSITTPEIIPHTTKLSKWENCELSIAVTDTFRSEKPGLIERRNGLSVDAPRENGETISSKAEAYRNALNSSGIILQCVGPSSSGDDRCEIPCNLKQGWARYPGNCSTRMSKDIALFLKNLYDQGVTDKKHRISAYKAHDIFLETIGMHDWKGQLSMTVAKIKAFFSMKPTKMKEYIVSTGPSNDDELFEDLCTAVEVQMEEMAYEEEIIEAEGMEE